MIHPNLVVRRFTFYLLTFYFLCHLLKCAPSPKSLYHTSIAHKTKYETTFFKNDYGHPLYTKIYIILSKRDNVIENIQIRISWQMFFFGLKICTNMKNKYEKGIFDFFIKKLLDLKKVNNYVMTFPYWFWFGNIFFNV